MPKARVGCKDCGYCQYAPGMAIGLCWRPFEGPQIVSLAPDGFCGDELVIQGDERVPQMPPPFMWLTLHKHERSRLDDVLRLLRLASVGPGQPESSAIRARYYCDGAAMGTTEEEGNSA